MKETEARMSFLEKECAEEEKKHKKNAQLVESDFQVHCFVDFRIARTQKIIYNKSVFATSQCLKVNFDSCVCFANTFKFLFLFNGLYHPTHWK